MWTFKTLGEGEDPNGFDATFDGPVEDAEAVLAIVSKRAEVLMPAARDLCQAGLRAAAENVKGVENGKRRFSMNFGGGVNAHRGWSYTMTLNLADEPEV
jgi:hypothetical protein